MDHQSSRAMRLAFWHSLLEGVRICWPVLSGVLVLQAILGAIVGLAEGWGAGQGLYFAFVTGLTIGYGDLVPTTLVNRLLAVAIGLLGIVLTGLVAAIAVRALQSVTRR